MELLKDVSINPEYAADFIPELVAPKWDRTDPEQVKKMPVLLTTLITTNKRAALKTVLCPRSGVSGSR
jgi:hypothetical protein